MKIAVTSKGKDLDAQVDPRFGRAAWILIIDTDSLDVDALDNTENINAFKGAGIQAGVMVSDRGAKALLTGYCGPNAFKTLKAAGVKVVNNVSGIVKEAVQNFKDGKYTYAEAANAEGQP